MTDFTPKFDLAGKVVLVTGASRGIGRACALACAGSGADMIVGVRSKADGAELVAEIERIGRRALAVQMDATDLATVRKGVADAHAAFGRIDILVNNVGLGPENLAENVTEEDFDLTVNVNLKGTFFTTQAVGKLMIAQKGGRIINISSQAGTVTLKGEAIYCMTKAAIALPGGRMGAAQDRRQQRGADLHLDRRHTAVARRTGLPCACARPHSARPHRRPDRCSGNRRVPRFAGSVADYGNEYTGRWRLVGGVGRSQPI